MGSLEALTLCVACGIMAIVLAVSAAAAAIGMLTKMLGDVVVELRRMADK